MSLLRGWLTTNLKFVGYLFGEEGRGLFLSYPPQNSLDTLYLGTVRRFGDNKIFRFIQMKTNKQANNLLFLINKNNFRSENV